MGKVLRFMDTFVRPADATQYAAGDEISNHATAGSVVRAKFNLSGYSRGRILAASVDITPASGNLVITALNFDLLIFKTAEAPAAVGDNVTHPISGATRRKEVGRFLFDDGGWQNPLGAFAASTSGYQSLPAQMQVGIATPTIASPYEHGAWFDFTGANADTGPGGTSRELTVVLQALAAWNPGNVANTFGIALDIEVD